MHVGKLAIPKTQIANMHGGEQWSPVVATEPGFPGMARCCYLLQPIVYSVNLVLGSFRLRCLALSLHCCIVGTAYLLSMCNLLLLILAALAATARIAHRSMQHKLW